MPKMENCIALWRESLTVVTAIAFAFSPILPVAAANATNGYDTITIVSPTKDETLFDNNGNVDIALNISPSLQNNDRMILFLDGLPISPEQTPPTHLSGLDRGAHTLQAKVVDKDGNTLISSDIVTFHVWHASRLFPNRSH